MITCFTCRSVAFCKGYHGLRMCAMYTTNRRGMSPSRQTSGRPKTIGLAVASLGPAESSRLRNFSLRSTWRDYRLGFRTCPSSIHRRRYKAFQCRMVWLWLCSRLSSHTSRIQPGRGIRSCHLHSSTILLVQSPAVECKRGCLQLSGSFVISWHIFPHFTRPYFLQWLPEKARCASARWHCKFAGFVDNLLRPRVAVNSVARIKSLCIVWD